MDILQYRPCGPCRELVDVDKGCEHWTPFKPARIRRTGAVLYHDEYSIMRLAESSSALPALRMSAREGGHNPGQGKRAREVYQRLTRAGLTEVVGYGGAFVITEHGRSVLQRAESYLRT